jgi:hypothetical protein
MLVVVAVVVVFSVVQQSWPAVPLMFQSAKVA